MGPSDWSIKGANPKGGPHGSNAPDVLFAVVGCGIKSLGTRPRRTMIEPLDARSQTRPHTEYFPKKATHHRMLLARILYPFWLSDYPFVLNVFFIKRTGLIGAIV